MSERLSIGVAEIVDWLNLWGKLSKDWWKKVLSHEEKMNELWRKVDSKSELIKDWVTILDLEKWIEKMSLMETYNAKDILGWFSNPLMRGTSSLVNSYIKNGIDVPALGLVT